MKQILTKGISTLLGCSLLITNFQLDSLQSNNYSYATKDEISSNYYANTNDICSNTFSGYEKETLVFEKDIENICQSAFEGCMAKTIVFEGAIKNICKGAFEGCMAETIVFKETIGNICENSFYNCLNLVTIKFVQRVDVIEKSAFNNCERLMVVISEKVAGVVDDNAFNDCDAINSPSVNADLTPIQRAIMEDDIDELKRLSVFCNFDYNIEISYQDGIHDDFYDFLPTSNKNNLRKCCLLCYAILCNAEKCYRSILESAEFNIDIFHSPNTPNGFAVIAALASNNAFFIHQCEQYGLLKNNIMPGGIIQFLILYNQKKGMHNIDLIRWITLNFPEIIQRHNVQQGYPFLYTKLDRGCSLDGIFHPIVDDNLASEYTRAILEMLDVVYSEDDNTNLESYYSEDIMNLERRFPNVFYTFRSVALDLASKTDKKEIIDMALSKFSTQIDLAGGLYIAAASGNPYIIRKIFEKNRPVDIIKTAENCEHLLYVAVDNNNKNVLDELFEYPEIKKFATDHTYSLSYLTLAIRKGYGNITKKLIECGCSVYSEDVVYSERISFERTEKLFKAMGVKYFKNYSLVLIYAVKEEYAPLIELILSVPGGADLGQDILWAIVQNKSPNHLQIFKNILERANIGRNLLRDISHKGYICCKNSDYTEFLKNRNNIELNETATLSPEQMEILSNVLKSKSTLLERFWDKLLYFI